MSVTFLVFPHHLRCSRELRLTFEAPSGGPLDEQQPAYLTFYESTQGHGGAVAAAASGAN